MARVWFNTRYALRSQPVGEGIDHPRQAIRGILPSNIGKHRLRHLQRHYGFGFQHDHLDAKARINRVQLFTQQPGQITGIAHRQAVLPPVVLSELLSDPRLHSDVKDLLVALPMLELLDGYWERAGLLRAKTLAGRRKAALADILIAQSCLDHDVELVTRDRDFKPLAGIAGLRLIPAPARS